MSRNQQLSRDNRFNAADEHASYQDWKTFKVSAGIYSMPREPIIPNPTENNQ